MSNATPSHEDMALMTELAAALAGVAREIDFVVSCGNTNNDGISVIQKGIPYIASLQGQLEALGYGQDLAQYSEVAARGTAFLESHGRSIA